ncbi:conserved hypothetical protein [Segniliparus rotundus DSM 44985]|uniref:HNH domain-containing protein n=1 Tax=Segniliparus rotundus (strain ATCC BAA-972 / CDC 1076 / CIP 108378 / DSM 44985 / JCM 13578) TaxID=640132 RepID=D6ZFB9_SEGRD|nr:HNH endonuclease [Segniliparus rotundus]ADG97643.1 conserved hypothetical protein [Segniliparus rotundus DSM 44985]
MAASWSGDKAAKLRARLRAERRPCWICRQPIDYNAPPEHPDSFQADHAYPRATHPHLAFDYQNLRASHARCNQTRGAAQPAHAAWARSEDF